MADIQQVERLLKELGERVGVGELTLRDGSCALLIDDSLEIELTFTDGDDRIVAAALLGSMPAGASTELGLAMLDANFFWRGTDGATLGVERDSGTVVLIDSMAVSNLHAGELETRLGRFVRTAQEWTARLAGDGAVPGGTAPGKEDDKGEVILLP